MSVAERWIGVIWAVFASAILGVLVAAGTGGRAPSAILLVVLVVTPVVLTLALLLRRSRRRHKGVEYRYPEPDRSDARPRRASRTDHPSPSPLPSAKGSPSAAFGEPDWECVSSICVALDARHLDWLRTNDFVTPWLDGRARPVLELEPVLAAAVDQPFEWELRSALHVLFGAIESFVAFYDDNTLPDPLLLGEDWRFFERDDLAIGAERSTGDDLWGGRAIHLHQLAAEVADAYESFVSVATRDARVRSRISLPV